MNNRQLKQLVLLRDGPACHWCGAQTDPKAHHSSNLYPTLEHLVPRHAGGSSHPSNLAIACRSCNSQRHHPDFKPVSGWKPPRKSLRIRRSLDPIAQATARDLEPAFDFSH